MSAQVENEETLAEFETWTKGADLTEGTRIHRYQILQLIGKGGMGAVYQAYDPELDRSIAIKILTVAPDESETASRPQARLMREAQALAKLNHPNVVAVHDVGTYEDGIYIAMEYVKGKTLREWIQTDKPTNKSIVQALFKAGQGLQAAHAEGIVHRDFKPENILIGDRGQVKVLDFGLARAAGSHDPPRMRRQSVALDQSFSGEKLLSTPLTQEGAQIGTTVYMAPEHFLMQDLDEKTDQFSYCVTLFEALYGKRPFVGKTVEELVDNVTSGTIEIPAEAEVPLWISTIILTGLSVSKSDRHPSMLDLLDALRHDPEIAKSQRRKKQLLLLTFVLGACLLLSLGFGLFRQSSSLCSGAQQKLLNIWNPTTKSKIDQAFSQTGLSYSHDTFVRVANRLDQYFERWREGYTETCQATHLRGEQSEELMDLKMVCLNDQLRNAKALVKVLGHADRNTVAKSVQAVSTLPMLATCEDVQTLQSRIPPPKDEHTNKRVEAIRESLAHIKALADTGQYQQGLEAVRSLHAEANSLHYLPLKAEVLYRLGELLETAGEYKNAEATLHQAALAAGESADSLLAAEVMAVLVWVVGYCQARTKEGHSLARATQVILRIAGGNSNHVRERLLNNLAVLYFSEGDFDKSLEHFQASLSIRETELGAMHPNVARLLNNIGLVVMKTKNYSKAFAYFRKSLLIKEQALGAFHPDVAESLANLGWVFQKQGKPQKALEHYRKALTIREQSLEPDHPLLAESLADLGGLYLTIGMPEKSLAVLEQVIQICAVKICQPQTHGRGLFGLVKALHSTGREPKRAIQLANLARVLYETNPNQFSEELQEVHAWLKNNSKVTASTAPRSIREPPSDQR